MPSRFHPPKERPKPSITKNITYALTFHPSALIINLPSNDAAYGYSNSEQLKNYDTVMAIASNHKIPVWIATPQPRNFPIAIINDQINFVILLLIDMEKKVSTSGIHLRTLDGTLDSIYGFGDGIHLNNFGHRIIFEKVVDADILDHLNRKINYTKPFVASKSKKEIFIDSLMLKMTFAEKVGQLVQMVGVWIRLSEDWVKARKSWFIFIWSLESRKSSRIAKNSS